MMHDSTADPVSQPADGWDVLFDALFSVLSPLAEQVREAIQDQLPEYRVMDSESLDDEIALQLELVLRSARDRPAAASEYEFASLVAIGETRARQGVPIDEMLRAWRIGIDVVVSRARGEGRRLRVADAAVLEFVQSTLNWSDIAMVATARAHRRAELAFGFAEQELLATFVRGVLSGTIPAAELGIQAKAYGLDPACEYVALRALLSDVTGQRQLECALGFHDPARYGLCVVVDGRVVGFLNQSPPQDIDAVVGVGPPKPLGRLAESYRLATRALTTLQACGIGGAHDLASLGVWAAVAVDADVGDAVRKQYLEPLEEGGTARELIATLRAFLECGMRVERAAARLFVHQNTVRYRLARFEELTGANLREAVDLFGVWWALQSQQSDAVPHISPDVLCASTAFS